MTFITKRHLSRRTFLHGMGVSMALPLLDSMIPAQTALRLTAATPRNRFACVYVPHGATMDKWTPATEGTGFAFTEILKPLEPFRDRVNIVSGLAHPFVAGAGGADVSAGANHTRAAAVFLTGSVPERGPQAHLGTSVDQVAARQIGQDTPLPSLELSIEESVLACEASFSCAYRNSISWQSPTSPLPMENNPRLVFEKLFGTGSTDAERRARRQESRSLLDSVMGQVASLEKDLPAGDRRRLGQYLDDVREIERRIQRAEKSVPDDLTVPEVPAGVPPTFQEHLKLLMDLQVIAFQAEITRVSTLMFARELSAAVFPETTIRDPFHNLSHHSNDRSNMDRFAQLNTYHMTKFAYLVERLQEHARRRRHAARSLGGALRQLAQRREPAQLQPAADRPCRRGVRSPEGWTASGVPERHAHVEPAGRAARHARCESRDVRRQHGHARRSDGHERTLEQERLTSHVHGRSGSDRIAAVGRFCSGHGLRRRRVGCCRSTRRRWITSM